MKIKYSRCPECAKLGRDRRGNNLATYPDGHSFCYACGYRVATDGIVRFKQSVSTTIEPIAHSSLLLPEDVSFDIPDKPLAWLRKYELTNLDISLNNIMWSAYNRWLVFPIFDKDKNLILWQARNFNPYSEDKWLTQGLARNVVHIIGRRVGPIVLTEDLISAIKVAKTGEFRGIPLFGSTVKSRWSRIKYYSSPTDPVYLWLDCDKASEALTESTAGRLLNLNVITLVTESDPKDVPLRDIKDIIKNA